MINRLCTGLLILLLSVLTLHAIAAHAYSITTDTTTYGSGDYGDCDYGSCIITLTTNSSVPIVVTPGASAGCSVQKDQVTVTTDSTTGYTVSLNNTATNRSMVDGSYSIPASSGTSTSPTVLTSDYWGYRVDGISGFGSGPTTAQTNAASPSYGFAGIPANNQTPDPVAYSASPAYTGAETDVWYGVCVDTAAPPGTYDSYVTYTAVTN